MGFRVEKDFLGERQIPDEVHYGGHILDLLERQDIDRRSRQFSGMVKSHDRRARLAPPGSVMRTASECAT